LYLPTPLAARNRLEVGWSLVSTLDGAGAAALDRRGALQLPDASWVLDWWYRITSWILLLIVSTLDFDFFTIVCVCFKPLMLFVSCGCACIYFPLCRVLRHRVSAKQKSSACGTGAHSSLVSGSARWKTQESNTKRKCLALSLSRGE
jgi:hypothetical protein